MSYPPCENGPRMNENKEVQKRISKLEQLTPEQQQWILETSLNAELKDMTLALREHGIDTSPASLSRFIKKDRETRVLEDRQESQATVAALAEAGKEGTLRAGTLEAVRQRLYERALVSQSPEEAMELYAAMVKEEMKLKEMELEARKVAAMEQQVKLQGVKIQVLAQGGGKGRVKAEVASSSPEAEEVVTGKAVAQLTEGERAELEHGGAGSAVTDEVKEKLLAVLREVDAEINRGGPPEDKVIAVRGVMKRERRLIGGAT